MRAYQKMIGATAAVIASLLAASAVKAEQDDASVGIQGGPDSHFLIQQSARILQAITSHGGRLPPDRAIRVAQLLQEAEGLLNSPADEAPPSPTEPQADAPVTAAEPREAAPPPPPAWQPAPWRRPSPVCNQASFEHRQIAFDKLRNLLTGELSCVEDEARNAAQLLLGKYPCARIDGVIADLRSLRDLAWYGIKLSHGQQNLYAVQMFDRQCRTGINYLAEFKRIFDLAYADPAKREPEAIQDARQDIERRFLSCPNLYP